MMAELNGGIISNGEITINLSDIVVMVSVYEMLENDGRTRKRVNKTIDDDDEALKNSDYD